MSAPNPYLPGADGMAPGNGYTWTSQGGQGNGAQQVAKAIAFGLVKYGPHVLKALRSLR